MGEYKRMKNKSTLNLEVEDPPYRGSSKRNKKRVAKPKKQSKGTKGNKLLSPSTSPSDDSFELLYEDDRQTSIKTQRSYIEIKELSTRIQPQGKELVDVQNPQLFQFFLKMRT